MENKYKSTVILIGPCGSGKSTVGELLEKKLGKSFYNMDLYESSYTQKYGFDLKLAEAIKKEKGFFEYYEYCRKFFHFAVEEFLREFSGNILELGGGHPIVRDVSSQKVIKDLLEPYVNVFLLMPVRDKFESLEILRERNGLKKEEDLNELFLNQDTFFEIAKKVVFTHGKSPEQTAEEVLGQINFDV